MKRLCALILALSLIFTLCACGETENDVRGGLTDSEEAAPASKTAEEEAEKEMKPGRRIGCRYENKFFGIGCRLDENWSFANTEELASLIGVTAEMFDDEEYAESLKNADMFYDMFATGDDGAVSINVIIQNLGIVYGTAMSEEQYAELAARDIDTQLKSAGFRKIDWKPAELEFAGEEHRGLHISAEVQGLPYFCTQVYLKQGSYMAVLSFVSYYEDVGGELMKNFFAL